MTSDAKCPVDLAGFQIKSYQPGRSLLWRAAWFLIGAPVLRCSILPSSRIRRVLLRSFGAKIGSGVVIKPGVRVKYPWRLSVGDHSWIGEDCWIDNLAEVRIGANACISQGIYICTGNHDWSAAHFDLIVRPIILEDGVWIGARATVTAGVHIHTCAVATAGSVVNRDIPAFEIRSGNPAQFVRKREVRQATDSTTLQASKRQEV
jgi:putative colanic acid biosynthesis acetyltransferase WcaF